MNNLESINFLEAGFSKWPKEGLHFIINDLNFDISIQSSDDETYDVFVILHSMLYGIFLNQASKLQNKLQSSPRIRQVIGDFDSAVIGQVLWEILNPEFKGNVNELGDVFNDRYTRGEPLLPLGYSIIKEENLFLFLRSCYELLCDESGLFKAHMKERFLAYDLAGFDSFYSYVYSCHKASLSAQECLEFISKSCAGVSYPVKSMAIENIILDDIILLYELMENSLKLYSERSE